MHSYNLACVFVDIAKILPFCYSSETKPGVHNLHTFWLTTETLNYLFKYCFKYTKQHIYFSKTFRTLRQNQNSSLVRWCKIQDGYHYLNIFNTGHYKTVFEHFYVVQIKICGIVFIYKVSFWKYKVGFFIVQG